MIVQFETTIVMITTTAKIRTIIGITIITTIITTIILVAMNITSLFGSDNLELQVAQDAV